MGRPQTSCMGLGLRDFIRVDLPAARMSAVVDTGAGCCGRRGEKATPLGFEPRQSEPKSLVLPLHYGVVEALDAIRVVGGGRAADGGEEERAGVRDGRGQLEEKPPAEGSEGVFPFTFPGLRASQRASGV